MEELYKNILVKQYGKKISEKELCFLNLYKKNFICNEKDKVELEQLKKLCHVLTC